MAKSRALKSFSSVKMFDCAKSNILSLTLKVFAIVAISIFISWCAIPQIVKWIIAWRVVISPTQGPEMYPIWLRPPIPIHFKVYMFNVTNPEEIEAGGQPRFKEIGPYYFEEIRSKLNITLDDATDTATYFAQNLFEFRSELSGNLSIDDVVTTINVPFAAAAIKIDRDVPWPINHVAHMILLNYKEPLFVQRTVNEILFKGWRVPFLDQIEEEIGLTFIPNNTFGFFWEMNNTVQGPFHVDRGLFGNKSEMARIFKYRNEPYLPFWGKGATPCNKLKGTDAFIFAPLITKNQVLEVFSAELCGSLHLDYVNETEISGIPGYHFAVSPNALETPWERNETKCYCVNGKDQCLGTGALDLGPCRDGAPVALSLPHFLDGDPKYLKEIKEGLKPDRSKHQTFIDVEPTTGIVLQASKRLQLSLILKPVGNIPSMSKVREMLFPCVWADEGAYLEGPYADWLKNIVTIISVLDSGSKYLSMAVSILFPAYLFWQQLKVSEQDEMKVASKSYMSAEKMERLEKIVQEKLCLKCGDSNEYDDIEECQCECKESK